MCIVCVCVRECTKFKRAAVAQSVERANSGEEVLGLIAAVAAHSLQVMSMSV